MPQEEQDSLGDWQVINDNRGKKSMKTICLVSCASKKRLDRLPARDINVSELFREIRKYIESTGCPWFILSAKHGLLRPDEIIEPYDQTLNKMPVRGRKLWAARVLADLKPILLKVNRIEIFAGKRYREFIEDILRQNFEVIVPLEGLRIGQQIHWLKRKNLVQAF
jgi:hypothetical protein